MHSTITPIVPGEPHYVGSEIQITENAIDAVTCRELMAYADANAGNRAYVNKPRNDSLVENTYTEAFVAERIDVFYDKGMTDRLNRICEDYYRNTVEPFYQVEIEWFEVPHLLRYSSPGGKCSLHADAENWNAEEYRWERGIDRDYSSVIYFNSGYEGGKLAFPELNIRITPTPGMIVTFPTDHRFVHEVEEMINGTRYSCVMWAVSVGSERCNRMVTEHIVRLRKPRG
jgi:hypothetical protein